jgi:5-(carboxyamino)imidazole ribonucleotide synthase
LKNYFSSKFTLGVLGGGQLGKMLLAETHKYDIYTAILDNDKNAPCSEICNRFEIGNLLDYDAVYAFGKTVDLLTIEIENVNIDALDQLEK